MAILFKNFKIGFGNLGPVILLYFLSITDMDTEFSNFFEILSFNLQLIVIYYWALKDPEVLGNGHIFFAGIINDLMMALPLGTSALSYLVTALVASYIRNVTVNNSLFTDWFTFLIAIFFSNLTYLILISNFSNYGFTYTNLFYNSFFTFLFYPIFWLIFNLYKSLIMARKND
jgi:rod shape-determining protein MreD